MLNVVDCHAEGESGKVVVGGLGRVPGATMFDKREHLESHLDHLRKLLLCEPRGAVWHNANFILPSQHPQAELGYVIAESTEYPAMSGSNTMCVATVLLETGMVAMSEPVTEFTLESPAGLIRVRCDCHDGKVERVTLTNQPAFVHHSQAPIEVEGLGTVIVDVAYGGMTYAIVDAASVGFALDPSEEADLCRIGQDVKRAAVDQLPVSHPLNPRMPGITNTEFTGPLSRFATPGEQGLTARNAVVVSPGRIDRSPCGTGTSARLAVMRRRGQIQLGELFRHESLIGSGFDSRVISETTVGSFPAAVTTISGRAWISSLNQLVLDPSDPFPEGFVVGRPWLPEGHEPG